MLVELLEVNCKVIYNSAFVLIQKSRGAGP